VDWSSIFQVFKPCGREKYTEKVSLLSLEGGCELGVIEELAVLTAGRIPGHWNVVLPYLLAQAVQR
jgi:hypothetical protein